MSQHQHKGVQHHLRISQSGMVEKLYTGAPNAVLIANAESDVRLSKGLRCKALLIPNSVVLDALRGEVVARFDIGEVGPLCLKHSTDTLQKLMWMRDLCQSIAAIHKQGMLCTGLRGDCFFVDENKQLRFINALPFVNINAPISVVDPLRYTPLCPYAAPELVDKISVASVDHRTDYYAMGVIFYEWLTGLPFRYDDHYTPILPPETLDHVFVDIISKLTNRFPQHRYQSMHGLLSDLSVCIDQLQTSGRLTYFLPGMQDRMERFVFKDQLYGRDFHLKTLMTSYEDFAKKPGVKVVLLRGGPGVGKTAIAHCFLTRLRKKNEMPFIAQGKSDQIFDTHYSVIIQILRHVFRYIWEDKTYDWQARLNQDLYPYGRLLSTLVPELDSFFASQPEVPSVDSAKEKQRFHYFLSQFFRCVSDVSGRPLVLFVDDLQWVDSSTLDFLRFLVGYEDQSLFVLGSYRDALPGKNKHLGSFLEACEGANHFLELPVVALSENDVVTFVSDLFPQATQEDVALLAKESLKRTFGNPFFLKQMFLNAWDQNYIVFERHTKKMIWDLEKIKEIHLDGNSVDLVIDRISLLPKMTQDLLKIAAIMGQHFYLEDLSNVVGQDPISVSLSLWAGIQEDFVAESSESKLVGEAVFGEVSAYRYAFLHDRIQAAFYSLVDQSSLSAQHYRIANTLKNKRPVPIFVVANHLLAAKGALQTMSEKKEALLFCLEAGCAAKKESAFEAARTYFKFSAALSFELGDQIAQNTQFEIQLELAEATYLCGDFDDAIVHFEYTWRLCGDDILQRARLSRVVIAFYTRIESYDKAMDVGISILKQLGIRILKKPFKIQTLALSLWTRWVLRQNVHVLMVLPEIRDKRHLEITILLTEISAAAYFTELSLYANVIARLALFSAKHGASPNDAFSYIAFSNILISSFNDFSLALQIGNQVVTDYGNAGALDTDPRPVFLYSAFVSRFHHSLKETLRYCDKAHQLGLKSGDVIYTNYAIVLSLVTMLAKGMHLESIFEKTNREFVFVQKMRYLDMYYDLVLVQIFVHNLSVSNAHPTYFKNDFFEESVDAGRLRLLNHRTADSRYQMLKMQLLYLFEDYTAAMVVGYESERVLLFSYGLITVDEHYFYFGLTLIKNCEGDMSWPMRLKARRKISYSLKKMGMWAKVCPQNYAHKYLLLLGEWYRLKGALSRARASFKAGISLAKAHGFVHIVALGYELQWGLDQDPEDLKQAYTYYLKWGATTKADHLKSKYPDVLGFKNK